MDTPQERTPEQIHEERMQRRRVYADRISSYGGTAPPAPSEDGEQHEGGD